MEYMTGYYRQQKEVLSLLLQQYICCDISVCFGCICGGTGESAGRLGGEVTGWLLQEFRRMKLRRAIADPERESDKLRIKFQKMLSSCTVNQDFWIAGIFCIGGSFLLFYEGRIRLYLCNTGFGQPVLQRMDVSAVRTKEKSDGIKSHAVGKRYVDAAAGSLQFQWGRMEKNIGVLLASEDFCRYLSAQELKSCLAVQDIQTSVQTVKRVQELGRAAENRGAAYGAAILLEVR